MPKGKVMFPAKYGSERRTAQAGKAPKGGLPSGKVVVPAKSKRTIASRGV